MLNEKKNNHIIKNSMPANFDHMDNNTTCSGVVPNIVSNSNDDRLLNILENFMKTQNDLIQMLSLQINNMNIQINNLYQTINTIHQVQVHQNMERRMEMISGENEKNKQSDQIYKYTAEPQFTNFFDQKSAPSNVNYFEDCNDATRAIHIKNKTADPHVRVADQINSTDLKKDKNNDTIRTTITITPLGGFGNQIGNQIGNKNGNLFMDSPPRSSDKKKDKKNTNEKEKGTEKKNDNDSINIGKMEGLLPFLLLGEMFGGKMKETGAGESKLNSNDVFNEIKLPDMKRDIRKSVELKQYDDFEELKINDLDDIVVHGDKFISMINDHNKTIGKKKSKNNIKHITTKNLKKEKDVDVDVDIDGRIESIGEDDIKKMIDYFFTEKKDELSETSDVDTVSSIDTVLSNKRDRLGRKNKKHNKKPNNKKETTNNPINIDDMIEIDNDGLYPFFGKRYSLDPRRLMRLVKPINILNSMVGMKEVKGNIFQFISSFLQNKKNDGMLNTAIYGKPGIGKTDLGKILCMIYSALDIVPSSRFTLVKASDLVGQYVGQTRQKTMKVIKEADGGVLFIDEAYALTSGSGDKYSYGKECIDTLNQELSENRRKLVVIIAGYEKEIKEGFFKVNQGLSRRFPFRYILKDYSKDELKDIFLRMMRINNDMFLDTTVSDNDITDLFADLRYFNNCGGDIENLITQIKFANNGRSLGKHPKIRNVITKKDLTKGLEMYKFHKEEEEDDSWKKMFV